MIKLKINNQTVKVKEDTSLLQAAADLGVQIPTLCYHPALSAYGACRLCLVEVQENGRSELKASCMTEVQPGMEVLTETERVTRTRRLMMELILARCPDSEEINQLADQLGVKKTRVKKKEKDDCILCGLCVRMCGERMGIGLVNFANRGTARRVIPPFDRASEICQACGACEFICPTNSIDIKDVSPRKARPLLDEFNLGLNSRPAIHIPYPQAIPNLATIDREHCVHFLKGECGICESVCAAEAIDFDQAAKQEEIRVGSIILSPGFSEYRAEKKHELHYRPSSSVVTSIEFERILSASGPYGGHVLRPSDQKEPKKVAFLQCVGSRDISAGNEYCSAVCCMYAIKEAIIAKEHLNSVEPTIFFMDMRAYGKDFDRYYEKAENEHGIRFIRSRVSEIEETPKNGLELTYTAEDGKVATEKFDLAVLSVGLETRRMHWQLAKRLGLRLNEFGFIDTDSLAPHRTSRPGVLVGGSASGPKDIPETVCQASGAAGEAAEMLSESRGSEITPVTYPQERDIAGEEPRVGVLICNCGINIGGVVNVPEVVAYAKTLPHVVYVGENLFTCSQDTQENIKKAIEEQKLNRVVVASCSPRTHEPLFQQTLKEAGLNPGLFEMANIRDQCSWIHILEPEEATEKAKDLVRMSVAKAALLEPLQEVSLDVIRKAVVIGGGPAGMVSALSLADQGFKVSLIEREKKLGGNLQKIHSTIEGKDVRGFLKSLIDRVEKHRLLNSYTGAEIESIEGYIGNYKLQVKVKGRKSPLKLDSGVIIVATGGEETEPKEYLYGKDRRVITQTELEKRLSNPQSLIPNPQSLIPNPQTIVMIQCVGSRDDERPYCSRVCCAEAVKNALTLKERNPETEVYILFRDMRTYGFAEQYYRKAREKGIIFIRYEKDGKPSVKKVGKKLQVDVRDPILNKKLRIEADLLVLAPAIAPQKDAEELARMLKVPLNQDGFFLEAHAKLRPVDFSTEGVFLAGLAHSPKTIGESISQAKAAAARAATIISRDKYLAAPIVAAVDEDLCAGCGLCLSVCSYDGPELVEIEGGKKVSRVNVAICKGCGSCAAACPSGAMQQLGFKSAQTREMVRAALEAE